MIGVVLSQTVIRQLLQSTIPQGTWVSLYAGEHLSIQLNTTTSEVDGRRLTTWVREDHNQDFSTFRGVTGKTVLSKVTIDCDSLLVAVHEQHAYNKDMSLIASVETNEEPSFPIDVAELVSVVAVCNIPIDTPKIEQGDTIIQHHRKPNLMV